MKIFFRVGSSVTNEFRFRFQTAVDKPGVVAAVVAVVDVAAVDRSGVPVGAVRDFRSPFDWT